MNPIQFPMLASGLTNTMTQSPEQQMVEQMMMAFQQQIQGQRPPQMEQVPQAPGAAQTFMSQLLGNLGSVLAQNPNYSQQAAASLEGQRARSEGAKLRNKQREEAFSLNKEATVLKFAEKRLDMAIDRAKQLGDLRGEKELAELKAGLIRKQHEVDLAGELALIESRRQSQIDVENAREANRQKPKPPRRSIHTTSNTGGGSKASGGKTTQNWPVQWRQRWAADRKQSTEDWKKAIRRGEATPAQRDSALAAQFDWYEQNKPSK